MPEDIGFAVVGLRRGYQAAKEVVATKGAKLVAVADLDIARAKEVAAELGCEWTAEYRDLLSRDDVQVMGAWTPSGAHGMVARDALNAGKHAVSTKPMETTVAKCDAMIDAARKRIALSMRKDGGGRDAPPKAADKGRRPPAPQTGGKPEPRAETGSFGAALQEALKGQ